MILTKERVNKELRDITSEKALEIIAWMEDDRGQYFLEQLTHTENYLIEQMLTQEDKEKISTQIKTLRWFPVYHDLLMKFISEKKKTLTEQQGVE